MVGHGGSSAGSYLADPTSPIPSHCASIVVTSTVRVKYICAPNCLSAHAIQVRSSVKLVSVNDPLSQELDNPLSKHNPISFFFQNFACLYIMHCQFVNA